jgi:hypothetical protein
MAVFLNRWASSGVFIGHAARRRYFDYLMPRIRPKRSGYAVYALPWSSLLTTVLRGYQIVLGGDGALLADQLGIWRPNPSVVWMRSEHKYRQRHHRARRNNVDRAPTHLPIWPRAAAIPDAFVLPKIMSLEARAAALETTNRNHDLI